MQAPQWIQRPKLVDEGFNPRAILPYGLTVDVTKLAIEDAYNLLHKINSLLVSEVAMRLEELMLTNQFAGLLSEILVKRIAAHSDTVVRNKKIGGYPDLIPKGRYPNDSVLKGKGVELKASKQKGGWQGHNPEGGWITIFRYAIDKETESKEDRKPTEIIEVLAAELTSEDWSFSGRKKGSRRTPTASILRSGVEKLRSNTVYLKPEEGSQAISRRP